MGVCWEIKMGLNQQIIRMRYLLLLSIVLLVRGQVGGNTGGSVVPPVDELVKEVPEVSPEPVKMESNGKEQTRSGNASSGAQEAAGGDSNKTLEHGQHAEDPHAKSGNSTHTNTNPNNTQSQHQKVETQAKLQPKSNPLPSQPQQHTPQPIPPPPIIDLPTPQPIYIQPIPQPTETIQGQVEGNTVDYQKIQKERQIEYQLSRTKQNARLDYSNVMDYAFLIRNIQVFYFQPDHDTDIIFQFIVYWQRDDTFAQSTYEIGQEVKISITENNGVLYSDQFYHSHGLTIHAKKGRTYALKIVNRGHNKLITMIISNYMESNRLSNKVNVLEAVEHELQIEKMKNTLRTFYGVVEKNYAMNQQIASNVAMQTQRYMSYQIIEMVLVIVGSAIQVYLVRGLLNPRGIV